MTWGLDKRVLLLVQSGKMNVITWLATRRNWWKLPYRCVAGRSMSGTGETEGLDTKKDVSFIAIYPELEV